MAPNDYDDIGSEEEDEDSVEEEEVATKKRRGKKWKVRSTEKCDRAVLGHASSLDGL